MKKAVLIQPVFRDLERSIWSRSVSQKTKRQYERAITIIYGHVNFNSAVSRCAATTRSIDSFAINTTQKCNESLKCFF